MTDMDRQKTLRAVGLYIVAILVILRFLVYPLSAAVADRKISLAEQYESYKHKYRLLERQKEDKQRSKVVADKTAIFPQVYEKKVGYFHIQADILEEITKFAEKKGMTVLNFEMPEPVIGKNVSEASVIIRLQAKLFDIIETLEMIEKGKRILRIKSMELSKSGQDYMLSLTLSAFRAEK